MMNNKIQALHGAINRGQRLLHIDMQSIIIEHLQYFNARCIEGKGEPVWELYNAHLDGTAERSWSRGFTPRSITGYLHGAKISPPYSQVVTADYATCTCKAYEYSKWKTCKHLQAMLLLLYSHPVRWIDDEQIVVLNQYYDKMKKKQQAIYGKQKE